MPSIGHAGSSGLEALWGATAARHRQVVRWVGLIGAAASLAACAQSSVVSRRTAFAPPSARQAAFEPARETHVSVVMRQVTPHEQERHVASAGPAAGGGVASFYTEGSSTASGERYNPNELTAAHPSQALGMVHSGTANVKLDVVQ